MAKSSMWWMMSCPQAGSFSHYTKRTCVSSLQSAFHAPSAIPCAGSGKNIRNGRKDSCPPPSIGRCGAAIGKKCATRTQRPKVAWAGRQKFPRLKPCSVISRVAERKQRMLKVAIIGCGKIADSHAAQIQRVKGCEIVAVYDHEELMARQLCERFQIKGCFSDVKMMLTKARPNVVHITTPPQSHHSLAKLCLDQGCHVYVEKPFTLNTMEAVDLIEYAESKKLKVTAGHDDQFRHGARKMRELAAKGYLGSGPVHMEGYYCYELGKTSSYARALLADKEHWVRRLPGGLLHNIISHGIARIAE